MLATGPRIYLEEFRYSTIQTKMETKTIANADSNSAQDITNENMETVERIINTFPSNSICLGGAKYWTFLHSASKRGDTDVVQQLLVAGADINARDSRDRTPIYYAIESNNLKMTKKLLDNGANVKDSTQLIHAAVKVESREIIEILLQHNADANSVDEHGKTGLHLIALSHNPTCKVRAANKIAIIELLLAHGAHIDAQTKDGLTPLHAAAQSCTKSVLQCLLTHGANVNARMENKTTPLLCATNSKNFDIVEILLTLGANVNAAQQNGATALHIASEKGHYKIAEMLLEYGANVDAIEKYGRTALHFASIYARTEITELLLAHGADINTVCENKCTALDYANFPKVFANIYSEEMTRSIIGLCKDAHNLWNYRQVAKVLRMWIMKMRILGLFVSVENLRSIDSEEEYEETYYYCKSEIDLMRFQKIGKSKVSFYDILTKSVHQVTKYAKNHMIEQVFDTEEYRLMFPLFSSMIAGSFRRGVRRKQLLHSSATALEYFVGYRLPNIVSTNILLFLNNEELQNLLKASHDE